MDGIGSQPMYTNAGEYDIITSQLYKHSPVPFAKELFHFLANVPLSALGHKNAKNAMVKKVKSGAKNLKVEAPLKTH